jgi:glycosyltransferase involved in cell wall biosynthesis
VHISVVIPTHGKVGLLRRTLASLERQTFPRSDFEVVVVDDSSPDETPEFLRTYAGPLRLLPVFQNANRGRAAARNAGLAAAGGELIVFLDDDMETVPEFLAAHHAFHAEAPDRVGVGDVENAPEVTDSPIVRYMSTRGAQKIRGRGPLPWKYFSTNNSSVRRSHLARIGFFDEEFVTYGFEDLELGYRLFRNLGLTFWFVEQARSLHIHYHDLDDVLRKKFLSGRSSLAVLFRKHPETRKLLRFHRYEVPRAGDAFGLIVQKLFYRGFLVPPVYAGLKSLAHFDWGRLSDRIFDYLVLYQTLKGLAEAESSPGPIAPREPLGSRS